MNSPGIITTSELVTLVEKLPGGTVPLPTPPSSSLAPRKGLSPGYPKAEERIGLYDFVITIKQSEKCGRVVTIFLKCQFLRFHLKALVDFFIYSSKSVMYFHWLCLYIEIV